jgi:hypothetical protein
VYGPVCTVVWQGSVGNRRPYADQTLKREEIHASTYRDFEDLRERMEEFIEWYYNVCRLH